MKTNELIVIGGGLAGCEAAWQAALRGVRVRLFEMRPRRMSEAHKTDMLAELVCSNSLRSKEISTGPGLLKAELEAAGSLIMAAAKESAVQAGSALAVDRNIFSAYIADSILKNPLISVIREEISSLPGEIAVLATGPLTSQPMAQAIQAAIGAEHLHFYDAIAPIIDAESIDYSKVFLASRYGKGGDDYVNCPMTKDEYDRFYDALMEADTVAAREFENIKVFEGCMPVEVMAKRGRDTLRFGPLKPVGLPDPKTGKTPYAVVQLRTENREKTAYNMVGFQTRLKWPEQKRVFSMVPGLEHAEFMRFGSIHRNTYINSPLHINSDLTMKSRPNIYVAGQISGVEGYIESTAMGLIAGINAARKLKNLVQTLPPRTTAHGSLVHHITGSDPKHFEPSNINFGLLPADEDILKVRDKKKRREKMAGRALKDWAEFVAGQRE
ncbi:MAG: methylenetetrahydrofolate--tRNA-(uracil(54)-C(5))-methyltransferase (FADH(2)-oxidizing) TrmFO [Nitrospirae bacterium]|nr:MAG: methylenetetrahydrofolate--tRNA-(uracil(54)-C(5))-methyltransferase (FADH(2)-oxidizing) TrmFO [Nitrospirota bacterium]